MKDDTPSTRTHVIPKFGLCRYKGKTTIVRNQLDVVQRSWATVDRIQTKLTTSSLHSFGKYYPTSVPGRYQVFDSNCPSCIKVARQLSGCHPQNWKIASPSHRVRIRDCSQGRCETPVCRYVVVSERQTDGWNWRLWWYPDNGRRHPRTDKTQWNHGQHRRIGSILWQTSHSFQIFIRSWVHRA